MGGLSEERKQVLRERFRELLQYLPVSELDLEDCACLGASLVTFAIFREMERTGETLDEVKARVSAATVYIGREELSDE